MAPALRRHPQRSENSGRATRSAKSVVDYREASTDNDADQSDEDPSEARGDVLDLHQPIATPDLSTSQPFATASNSRQPAQRSVNASRATRSAKSVVSYREPSTDTDGEPSYGEPIDAASDADAETRLPNKARRTNPKRSVAATSVSPVKQQRPLPQPRTRTRTDKNKRRKAPVAPKRESRKDKVAQCTEIKSLVIPKWASLPYQVLLQIFRYAYKPLYDGNFQPKALTVASLLKTARLCRAFAEPVLSVLYQSPPLIPMQTAHKLVELLSADPVPMSFNYRAKIERLQIEVSQTAMYRLQNRGLLNLHGLVKHCPRLADLELYHLKDMAPYRELDHPIKWKYPEELFIALEENIDGEPTRLKSWRWSSRLAVDHPLEQLREFHLRPSFHSLQKIAFVNYQTPQLRKDEEDPDHEHRIAECLEVLPDLKHLVFESCTLVNSKLLPLLPKSLQHLELINCWEITAEDLACFLLTHGHSLQSLVLNNNKSLSLSFLPVLAESCPNLKVLKMNLIYYNIHPAYHDSEPEYEHLLLPGEIPTWPASLQTIELVQLRQWDSEVATAFFQSLLDSAEHLPLLRYLVIKAILNIAWRDRSSFRDRWVGSFQRIFKRTSPPPVRLISLRPETQNPPKDTVLLETTQNGSSSRRVSHGSLMGLESSKSEQEGSVTSPRRMVRKRKQISYAEDDDSEDEPLQSRAAKRRSSRVTKDEAEEQVEEHKEQGEAKETFVQGMCEVVEVRIDNLRPSENQYAEIDFVGSEPEGDEDWDGTADVVGDGSFAW